MPVIPIHRPWLVRSTGSLSYSDRALFIRRYAELQREYDSIAHRGRPLELLLPCPSNPHITISQFLCSRARQGGKYTTSAHLVGVTPRSVRNWLARGRDVANMIESGEVSLTQLESADDNRMHYFKFYLDYRQAEGEYKSKLEDETIERALEGSERVNIEVVRDGDTVHEVVTSKTITRDGKAAGELLRVIDPESYALTSKAEIKHTGTGDGGEIEISNIAVDWRAILESADIEFKTKFLELFDEFHRRTQQSVIDVEVDR